MTSAAPGYSDEPAFPDDAVEVGRVIGAWGIKGWIRVQPFSSDPQALFSSRRWFVRPPELPGPKAAAFPRLLRITMAKEHGDGVVASAQEVPDRTAAEGMKGARIFIARSSFPTAGEGEYYWLDLIGLTVINRDGAVLGTVSDLLDTGAHSVLRVRRPDVAPGASLEESERLIPFVAAYIDDVSLSERRITVDWGLDY
ncbi:ribosome maturation factor RimM [Aquabacterium sp.]|uniref:ribosome maturation factor RimM n=1 Tax=Aquabacterium sp. TaxID=1872578 RepID=UPI002BF7D7B4|nr:ribosome maturation factor RimM [Aquabacterium sp.]HSW02986.1 ribosome maturation factor RimM [Aquabacterium sp.]